MLSFSNVSFTYGRRGKEVLCGLSLDFEENGIYGILGKNGTGKSTMLYLAAGLLRPKGGNVTAEGVPTQSRRPETLRKLFLVPEEFDLPEVSLRTYVQLNAPFYPTFREDILARCLKSFELGDDLNIGRLSMGQKKKVYISFALAAGTKYLLMDEPTNGLDIPSKKVFREVIAREMTEERVMIISTHQVRDVEQLIDHVVIVNDGTVLLNASTAEIESRLRFEQRAVGSDLSDALFVQQTMRGIELICPNSGNDETPIDLELLFNALQTVPTEKLMGGNGNNK
ncbi:MAG: ABC transporter ATP-binding protein [Bacteroidales bacterium]|nr:ABC transporter ATP-binding protein [Bacteroidales bacterium]